MKLINADELLKYMEKTEIRQYIDELNKGNDNYSSTALYGYIKEMPAAYDVEMRAITELQGVKEQIYTITMELARKGFEEPKGFSVLKGYLENRMKELETGH